MNFALRDLWRNGIRGGAALAVLLWMLGRAWPALAATHVDLKRDETLRTMGANLPPEVTKAQRPPKLSTAGTALPFEPQVDDIIRDSLECHAAFCAGFVWGTRDDIGRVTDRGVFFGQDALYMLAHDTQDERNATFGSAIWYSDLPQPGLYEVFAYLPTLEIDSRPIDDAHYLIGDSDIVLNQDVSEAGWYTLGTFALTQAQVEVTNYSSEPVRNGQRRHVAVDAIKWVYRGELASATPVPMSICGYNTIASMTNSSSSIASGQPFTIRVNGTSGDSCTPDNPHVKVEDGVIRLSLDETSCGTFCIEALTDWQKSFSIPALREGTYHVYLEFGCSGKVMGCASTTISVMSVAPTTTPTRRPTDTPLPTVAPSHTPTPLPSRSRTPTTRPPTRTATPRDCPILSGTVREASGLLVPEAHVVIDSDDEHREVASNTVGFFALRGIRGGNYRLRVLKKGYKYFKQDVIAPTGQCTVIKAVVEPEGWLEWPLKSVPGKISTYFDHQSPTLFEGCIGCYPYPSVTPVNDDGRTLTPFWTNTPIDIEDDDPFDRGTHIAKSGHNGIDIAGVTGQKVYAPADGRAITGFQIGKDGKGYGNYVDIDHENGCFTRFAHLATVTITNGQRAESGREPVGTVGDSGISGHPHLHMEVRCKGVPVDPFGWEPKTSDPWQKQGAPGSEWLFRDGAVANIHRDRVIASGQQAASLLAAGGDLSLEVPAGAFGSSPVVVTVSSFPDGARLGNQTEDMVTLTSLMITAANDSGAAVNQAIIALNLVFSVAAQPMPGDDVIAPGSVGVYRWDDSSQEWEELTGTGDSRFIRIATTRLGWFRVMARRTSQVYLPLSFDGAALDDGRNQETSQPPKPTQAKPSPTINVIATSVAGTLTAIVPPELTPTPEPSATPAKPPAGTIRGRFLRLGVPLTDGFWAIGSPDLQLRVRSGNEPWHQIENAIISVVLDNDGSFEFIDPPPLAADEVYQVWWVNDTSILQPDTEMLGRWYSPEIMPAQLSNGADVDLGTIELRDIELLFPQNDVHYGLPHEYRWGTRDELPSESYRWSLNQKCNDDSERLPPGSYRSPSVGHIGKVLISSPPQGFRQDTAYCWYVYFDDDQHGSGWSYYRYKTIFLSPAAHALSGMAGRLSVFNSAR